MKTKLKIHSMEDSLPGVRRTPLLATALDRAGAVVQLLPFLSGLSKPVLWTNAKDGTARIFFLEQGGRIKVCSRGPRTPTVFLDISAKIVTGGSGRRTRLARSGISSGLCAKRRFFVNYTRLADGATVIGEYHASTTDPNIAKHR